MARNPLFLQTALSSASLSSGNQCLTGLAKTCRFEPIIDRIFETNRRFFSYFNRTDGLDTNISEREMAPQREKALILVLVLFFISYFLFYSVIACVLGLLGDQMSGLFRYIVIMSAAVISALFFINQTHRLPTLREKTYLILISLFSAITIDIIAGRIFQIKAPPVIIWIFDVLILWSAFGPMLKKIAPKNDDNRKETRYDSQHSSTR